jgi:hypothetical protein
MPSPTVGNLAKRGLSRCFTDVNDLLLFRMASGSHLHVFCELSNGVLICGGARNLALYEGLQPLRARTSTAVCTCQFTLDFFLLVQTGQQPQRAKQGCQTANTFVQSWCFKSIIFNGSIR